MDRDRVRPHSVAMPSRRFDRDYYRRFYEDEATRVYADDDVDRLCSFVLAYLDRLEIDVKRVLDLGCGLGYWRDALARQRKKAKYHGVEISEHLCETMGWEHGSVVDWRGNGAFDFVICHGVLQYLRPADAERAIENLARHCRGALFLEVLTKRDWEENCDRRVTDGDVHLRTGNWYRRRLAPHFLAAGGGLWIGRGAGVTLFELETTG